MPRANLHDRGPRPAGQVGYGASTASRGQEEQVRYEGARCWRKFACYVGERHTRHGRPEFVTTKGNVAIYLSVGRDPLLSSQRCTAAGAACSGGRGRASSAAACTRSGCRTPTSSTTARRPRTRAAKRPWAGLSRGRGCNPASCVCYAPRRACERRAAAASRQVALAAAEFARLWILA